MLEQYLKETRYGLIYCDCEYCALHLEHRLALVECIPVYWLALLLECRFPKPLALAEY